MCIFANQDMAAREKRKPDPKGADAHYAHYAWLCGIKHATLAYAKHDSGSTLVQEKGYAIMPFPDIREEDWPVKKKILLTCLLNAIFAIRAFARGGAVKEVTQSEIGFAAKVKTVDDIVVKYLEPEIAS